ncbi:MAG: hypothetical protein AB8H03_22130 [Saprospiraceae bacterium]
MKNTIFFLAVIFVLQTNTFMIGQSNNSLSKDFKLIQIHQIDLVSAEMMSIVSMMLKEPSLLNQQNKINDLKLQSFEVRLANTLTSEANVSSWDAPNFSTVAHKDFLSTASVQQFEDLHSINTTKDMRWNAHESHLTNINLQNFIGENVKSFMQPSAMFRWVELENNEWIPSDVAPIPTNNFQIRNWQGQLGVGVGSYY